MTYRSLGHFTVSDDRWTCQFPGCNTTVVVTANPDDTRWCLRAAQHRHGLLHAKHDERKTA